MYQEENMKAFLLPTSWMVHLPYSPTFFSPFSLTLPLPCNLKGQQLVVTQNIMEAMFPPLFLLLASCFPFLIELVLLNTCDTAIKS